MTNDQELFKNQRFRQISNPSTIGFKTGRQKAYGTVTYDEILIEGGGTKFVCSDDLELVETLPTSIEDLLLANNFGTLGDLARVLTHHKIGSKLSNVFYAMQSSRTDFHAYQFKPVYKFIESFDNRILIADEVGLGKTIEAGLIWLEAQARSNAKRLLIVCPSMLREKWKKELRFRFNVRNAEIYDARGLCELFEEFENEGEDFQFAAVCSLQTVRQESVRAGLARIEETPGRFDLVIVDEAHHMRNSNTQSYAAGRILSDITEALVMLTATPIQLGNQDMFHLLSLLDPQHFEQQWQFNQLVTDNEPVVRAQSLLRNHPPKIDEAREQIESLLTVETFNYDTNLRKALKRLETLASNDHRGLVEVGLLLENLNLLSSHISRTRKREVVEWRVVRNSQSLEVMLSEVEAQFYQAVTECVQDRVQRQLGNQIAAFALMMPQRQMASCIPAMVDHYRNMTTDVLEIDTEYFEEFGVDAGDVEIAASTSWDALAELVRSWDTNTPDSKYNVLEEALRIRFQREPEAKVIVFSYFKKTLGYLCRRLAAAGFDPIVIHGDIPMVDRLELIDLFKTHPQKRILLSSEVGAEGIDLQFCRVMFNYDLPWNPMKVEQRIGRIDRLGQKADTISIVNFSVLGTIEEKILNRLYSRIGIFERSVGGLEPILGEKTQQLEFELLSQRLTAEQQDERIELTLRAAENEKQLEEQLAEQSTVFLGSSDYILEQIGIAREVGRRITSYDLRRFIEDFFERSEYYGSSIKWDNPKPGLLTLKLPSQARSDLQWFCQNQNPRLSTVLSSSADEFETLTYDSALAQEMPARELLTHFHALIRWIKSKYDERPELLFPVAAVELSTDLLPKGAYLITVNLWTFDGVKKSNRIEYEISSMESDVKFETLDAEKLVSEIIDRGRTWEHAGYSLANNAILSAFKQCDEKNLLRMETAFSEFRDDNDNLLERRKRHLEAFSNRKIRDVEQRIATMESKNMPERQLKGFRAMLENRRNERDRDIRELERLGFVSSGLEEIAAFVCRIVD